MGNVVERVGHLPWTKPERKRLSNGGSGGQQVTRITRLAHLRAIRICLRHHGLPWNSRRRGFTHDWCSNQLTTPVSRWLLTPRKASARATPITKHSCRPSSPIARNSWRDTRGSAQVDNSRARGQLLWICRNRTKLPEYC